MRHKCDHHYACDPNRVLFPIYYEAISTYSGYKKGHIISDDRWSCQQGIDSYVHDLWVCKKLVVRKISTKGVTL